MEETPSDKFINIQLRQCGYEQYAPLFKGMTPDRFLSLGFMEIREILPNDEVAQAKIFLWIKEQTDVHIVDEVIKGDFQLINASSIKVEEEEGSEVSDVTVSATEGIKRRKIKVEPGTETVSTGSPIVGTSVTPVNKESVNDIGIGAVEEETNNVVVSNGGNLLPIINRPSRVSVGQDQAQTGSAQQPQASNDLSPSNVTEKPSGPESKQKNDTSSTTNFEFVFPNISTMNIVLEKLLTEPQFRELKELVLSSDEDNVLIIGQEQMMKLLDLPQLKTLTTLKLNVGLSPDLLPFMDLLLTQATSLQKFHVKHGFMGSPGPDTEKLVLRLPMMPEIEEFSWAKDYQMPLVVQTISTLIELDDENDDDGGNENQHTSSQIEKRSPIPTLVNFDDITFEKLKVFEVGITVGIKKMQITQVPNLSKFYVQSFWDPLLIFPEGCPTNTIETIHFPVGISDHKHVELVIKHCPLLSQIIIDHPTIDCLKTLIKLINGSCVTLLDIRINYDFECALSSVFLGTPYTVKTLADKQKLKKLKEYKHWEKFVRHFKIEVPQEEDEKAAPQQRYGISGVTQLRKIYLVLDPKCIYMPSGDKLWSDLDFELSNERLSFWNFPLSSEVLLEFTKLKGLYDFRYFNFKISESDLKKFECKMNFAPVEMSYNPVVHLVDQKDALTNSISVKEEKN